MIRMDLDDLTVGHITDKNKDYLPWNMKPSHVQDIYEAKVMPLGERGHYHAREKDDSKTSKEMVWELAEESKASVVVVGNHGRKGPKADLTVAGTAIEYLSLNSQFPCLIIKDRKPRADKPDGCLRYGVCFDGSAKAKKVLELTCKLMRENDKLTTISVIEERRNTKDVLWKEIDEVARAHNITKVEKIELEPHDGKSVYQLIKHYLKYEASDIKKHGYIDFVCVGNDGVNFSSTNPKRLGSVANAVLRARLMNCLVSW